MALHHLFIWAVLVPSNDKVSTQDDATILAAAAQKPKGLTVHPTCEEISHVSALRLDDQIGASKSQNQSTPFITYA